MKFLFIGNKLYYEGQILSEYDMHGTFLQDVQIINFVLHHKKNNKKDFYCNVRLQSLKYKTKTWLINSDLLGKFYK